MKSSFELAMARFGGGELRRLTPEQKEQLAEVDRRIDAKIAQAKIRTEARLKTVKDEEAERLSRELSVELAGLNQSREREKERLRKSFEEKAE
ncbi:MAG: hypothetical protein BWZ02_01471 [Lentisphaerae bacterium ADurb.BinA184]|nr:MAG: hypothetical protein BWZ02_01471 [Lentisphaerae bacterium ADurb.BinA184]